MIACDNKKHKFHKQSNRRDPGGDSGEHHFRISQCYSNAELSLAHLYGTLEFFAEPETLQLNQ